MVTRQQALDASSPLLVLVIGEAVLTGIGALTRGAWHRPRALAGPVAGLVPGRFATGPSGGAPQGPVGSS